MPAIIPFVPLIAAGIGAAGVGAGLVAQNQQVQHAKGAAEAQQTAMDAQVKKTADLDAVEKKNKATNASATQSAALAALRASMGTANINGGTILTGGSGATTAPGQQKTLLGA